MRIGIDIDGVIADFATPFCRLIEAHYGKQAVLTEYGLGLTKQEYQQAIDVFTVTQGYLCMPPYEGALRTLRLWAQDHDIWYITRRRCGVHNQTREETIRAHTLSWLKTHGFPAPGCVIFTQDKAEACRERKVQIMVEDYHQDACKIHCAQTRCYLVDRPWNQSPDAGPIRVNSLQEIPISHNGLSW
jgi:uncharacterized HAD superfamily protein